MSDPYAKLKRAAAALALLLAAHALALAAQEEAFDRLSKLDFSKERVERLDLKDLSLWELQRLRGIIFGRHGRVFKDRDIQDYLKEQEWYEPRTGFQNSMLNETERANLDLIREMEAAKHDFIEPGDMRWWQTRIIGTDELGTHTAAEWRILRAEVEAVHGKRFDDQPWLQQYFEDRYWYKPDPNYDAKRLSEKERRNIATIDAAMRKQRGGVSLSPGDLEHFENREITEAMLAGLSLHELRLLRNEIYARRGRQFKTEWLSQYFWSQPWYQPREDASEPELSPVEKKNVETIVAYERRVKDDLSRKPLPKGLLEGMFLEDARKLRQEIYARHGKVFKDRWLQKYFQSFDWYKANPRYSDAVLSAVERQNIAAIAAYEKKATSVLDAVEG
ncbi:MAG TPA: YARHG domain-containing protein [Pyrinomonadaceae bacterium]|nr:YARHG domain-containing protein [Pyrinomonadaceae bacterium]